jgi:hypothetical protein
MSDQQVAPLSPRVKQYGTDQPLPARRTLRAGPLSVVLEGGDLRYVRVGDRELIRRLYMAVRDRNWGTIEPTYPTFEVDDRGDSFSVRFTAEHVQGEVDFAWTGTIEGTADGTIRYELRGEPRRPFLKNRIGFCVLHPMNLAGVPAMTTTPDGTVEGVFPAHISPHQPFIHSSTCSQSSMRHSVRLAAESNSLATCSRWKTSGTGPTPRTRPTARPSAIPTLSASNPARRSNSP